MWFVRIDEGRRWPFAFVVERLVNFFFLNWCVSDFIFVYQYSCYKCERNLDKYVTKAVKWNPLCCHKSII